jgi:hypothetical protein
LKKQKGLTKKDSGEKKKKNEAELFVSHCIET